MKNNNYQTIWSLPVPSSSESSNPKVETKALFKKSGDYKDLVQKGKEWLDKYIMPDQLVSVSLFEEEHDEQTTEIFLCIAHTAGEEPKLISEIATDYIIPEDGFYQVKVFSHES